MQQILVEMFKNMVKFRLIKRQTFIDIGTAERLQMAQIHAEDEEVQKSEKDQKFNIHAKSYISELMDGLTDEVLEDIGILANKLRKVWKRREPFYMWKWWKRCQCYHSK